MGPVRAAARGLRPAAGAGRDGRAPAQRGFLVELDQVRAGQVGPAGRRRCRGWRPRPLGRTSAPVFTGRRLARDRGRAGRRPRSRGGRQLCCPPSGRRSWPRAGDDRRRRHRRGGVRQQEARRGLYLPGQRAGRPARGVLGGDRDPAGRRPAGRRPGPRASSVVALLGRALAALPRAIRDGRAAAGRRSRCAPTRLTSPRILARAAAAAGMDSAIGAKRIAGMWKALRPRDPRTPQRTR